MKKSKVKAPKAPVKARRPHWRDLPDTIILALSAKSSHRAESLCPDADTVWRACIGDPRARAVTDAWKFVCPVVVI